MDTSLWHKYTKEKLFVPGLSWRGRCPRVVQILEDERNTIEQQAMAMFTSARRIGKLGQQLPTGP